MLTGVFRASYAYVFEPQASQNGGEPKYQITMLIPKSDTATVRAIQAGTRAKILIKPIRPELCNVQNPHAEASCRYRQKHPEFP